MTKEEYAQAIANMVNGEVKAVEKGNGIIRIGVCFGEGNIKPNVYIEDLYDNGVDIEEAVTEIKKRVAQAEIDAPKIDVNGILDFENAKNKLRVALYSQKTNVEVSISGEKWGFDDLIVCPYILVAQTDEDVASIKVTNDLLRSWGVAADEVIAVGVENSAREGSVTPIAKILSAMLGLPEEVVMPPVAPGVPEMYVVKGPKVSSFGAGVILGMRKQLQEQFPNGYAVVPSSIHELILLSGVNEDSYANIKGMIMSVNDTHVPPEEILGDHPYFFE